MEQLQITFRKLLNGTDTTFHRYMHERINWDARMIGLMGPRGIGKTTLVLQHIKEHLPLNESLYVQAEDFYFASNRLVDLAGSFAKTGGRYLFIDEIHKYKDWSRELKLIYDYYPELHVVFTGSSVLDIAKGAFDLSRRALMYEMQGLSYREYLELFMVSASPYVRCSSCCGKRWRCPKASSPCSISLIICKRDIILLQTET